MDTTTDRSIAKLTEKTWAVFIGDDQIGTIECYGPWTHTLWSYGTLDTQGVSIGFFSSLDKAADQLVSWFTADEIHGNKV